MTEPVHTGLGASALLKVAEAAAKDIYTKTTGVAQKSLDKLLVQFGVGFKKYVDRNYRKCRFVKNLLHRIDVKVKRGLSLGQVSFATPGHQHMVLVGSIEPLRL